MAYGDSKWKRAAAELIAGKACVRCDRPAEAAHHILPRAYGGSDDPSNLAPVCRRCHPSLERVARQKAFWLGYQRVPPGEPPRRVQRERRAPRLKLPASTRPELDDLLLKPREDAAS